MRQNPYSMGDRDTPEARMAQNRAMSVGHYRLCGVRCLVRADDRRLADLIDRLLIPFRSEMGSGSGIRTYLLSTDSSGAVSLTADKEDLLLKGSPTDAVEYLLWDMSQQAVQSVSDRLALHAGSLSWRGLGIVMPAPSGSGKSTLTAGLTAAGCAYLSDEVGLVDLESGTLHPFPRALWMTQQSIGLLPGLQQRIPGGSAGEDRPERHVPPDCLRSNAIGEPCLLRWVIVPEHVPGGDTVMEPMKRSEAVISMMTNAFNFDQFKGRGLLALARIAQQISAYRLRMADLSAAVDLVMEVLGEVSPGPPEATG